MMINILCILCISFWEYVWQTKSCVVLCILIKAMTYSYVCLLAKTVWRYEVEALPDYDGIVGRIINDCKKKKKHTKNTTKTKHPCSQFHTG